MTEMRIYIDEAGNFVIPEQPSNSFSVILALIVPATAEQELFYEFLRLRDTWPERGVEIKGSTLDEAQAAAVIDLLTRFDVVVEFVAIDMESQTVAIVEARKNDQADRLTLHLTREHHPEMVQQIVGIAASVREMANQLFIQAILTIELLFRVSQVATLYYVQRSPLELGDIAWFIDRKQQTVNTMEEVWRTLMLPMSESHFRREPLISLKDADYSHFDRRYKITLDDDMKRHIAWMEKTYGPSRDSSAHAGIDPKRLLTEQQAFVDSRDCLGVQLADTLASILRRALNGRLQRQGWDNFGRLLVQQLGEKSPFVNFGAGPTHVMGYSGVVGDLLLSKAKPLVHKA